jgi:hypothetical protein
VARTYVQAFSTILTSMGHLRVMLGPEEWRSVMAACCGLLEGGRWSVELLTAVIWSSALYGRLDDPSTLMFIQGLRRLVEGSTDARSVAKGHKPLLTTLSQASGRDWLLNEPASPNRPILTLLIRWCTAWSLARPHTET